jgi:RNA-directed DNA polymerase
VTATEIQGTEKLMWRRYAATFLTEAHSHGYEKPYIDACLSYAKKLILQGIPPIYDVEHLSLLSGYSLKYIYGVTNSSSNFYRKFKILKKNGTLREISEPLPSLKEIQSWILENILTKIPVNAAAKAFVRGRSIRDNARFHKSQKYIVTVDIFDFFGTIGYGRVYRMFCSLGYSETVSLILAKLCCLDDKLPQGSSTSPAISNIIFRSLDELIFDFARENRMRYTRYADDITLSGESCPPIVLNWLRSTLLRDGFRLNSTKTRVLRSHQRQLVTGIVVNSKLQAPRSIRRQLRKDAYYIEKYGIDTHAIESKIDRAHFREHLLGIAGFVLWLNPNDRDALKLRAILNQEL